MNKTVHIVLGGTSGMGLATATALGKENPVLIGGRNEKRLASALETLKAAGVEAYGKSVDISSKASLDEFVAYAIAIGKIGKVVNAAAIDQGTSEMIWKINVMGTKYVTEAFLPYLDNSCLLNFSSITGYFYQPTKEELELWSNPDAPDFFEKSFALATSKEQNSRMAFLGPQFMTYIASKRFVIYYTQANTLRFGKKNSQIFSVAPGSFDTPMLRENTPEQIAGIERGTAYGRLGKPEEMADFIIKLLEPGHEYLTGVDLVLDGGKLALSTVKQYQ